MRRKLIAGNWKMHGSLTSNAGLLAGISAGIGAESGAPQCEVAVCVPAPYLAQCQSLLQDSRLAWGAQDVSAHAAGAYTGEISAAMLQDFGCRFVIVGHSERRAYHGETSAVVAHKAQRALAAGLVPIVCVGETLAERESGATGAVVQEQLQAVLEVVAPVDTAQLKNLVLAYEPVWAIGTGRTATPEQAQAVHAFIRQSLTQQGAGQVRILYGGSVKAGNAASLFAQPDIDGALVGGASLVAQEFLNIAAA